MLHVFVPILLIAPEVLSRGTCPYLSPSPHPLPIFRPCRPFLLSFPGFEAPCLKPSMRTGPGDSTNCVTGSHKNRSAFGGSLPPDASRYRWLPASRCPNLALSLSHLVRDFVCASPPSGRHPSSSSDATDLRATTAKRRSRAATQGLSPGNATVTSDVEGRIEAIVPSKCTW